ncbi:MAG: hypothetical protein JRE23_08770 [Deltaproteobacteria bacterium]|nr:hypothetical protein [Deltaproteobacteria bacterium]
MHMYEMKVDGTTLSFFGPWAKHVKELCKSGGAPSLIRAIRREIASRPVKSVTTYEPLKKEVTT